VDTPLNKNLTTNTKQQINNKDLNKRSSVVVFRMALLQMTEKALQLKQHILLLLDNSAVGKRITEDSNLRINKQTNTTNL
jgi:hypothetical protein